MERIPFFLGIIVLLAPAAGAAEGPPLWTAPLPPLEALALDPPGDAIALRAGDDPVRIELLRFADCRAVRGFIHNPIDGRMDSRHYSGRIWEYPLPYGDGVHYDFHDGNGLHVTLADGDGFDAIAVRGGFRGELFRDTDPLAPAASTGERICAIESPNLAFRKTFPERVRARRLSFYGKRGYIADLSFYRVHRPAGAATGEVVRQLVGPTAKPPGELEPPLRERFGRRQMTCAIAGRDARPSSFVLLPYRYLHIVLPDRRPTRGIAALALDISFDGIGEGDPVAIRVQDPLDYRRELMAVEPALSGPGRYRIVLDFPDQVVPEDVPLWLTIACGRRAAISGPAYVEIHFMPEERARPEAAALRKLLLKGFFYAMSEPRPWNALKPGVDLGRWFEMSKYGPFLRELYLTLAECRTLAPKDDVVRQYAEWLYRRVHEPEPWKVDIPEIEGVPRWAVLAREAYRAARQVPLWWLAHRLVPTGEFGGRIGDDTDLYQNFADFPRIERGGLGARLLDAADRLADLALERTLERGINRRTTDPLHAYEEGTNQLCLLASWRYGDPVALERVMEAARSVEALLVRTEKGHLHFRSMRIGAAQLDDPPKPDRDGHTHPLFLHPVYEVAWYNRNPRAVKLLSDWARGWAAHQEAKVYPTAIRVPTEEFDEAGRFPGVGGYGSQGEGFLAAYWLTEDPAFLEPYRRAFGAGNLENADRHRVLPDLLRTERFGEFADAFRKAYGSGRGYISFALTGDKKELERDLEEALTEYRRFPHMYTAAEPFTDRVFLTRLAPVSLSYLGAFSTRNKFTHEHAASYEGLGAEFAALVLENAPTRLRILLVGFGDGPLRGAVRAWRLRHGRYRVRIGIDGDGDDRIDEPGPGRVRELFRGARIPVTLPPRRVLVLACERIEALDPLLERADLAVSAREIAFEDGRVRLPVHNIGARDARTIAVALIRDGREIARARIDALEAPRDLVPRRHSVSFEARPGDRILVDPDGAIPEICEENNAVILPRGIPGP